MYIVDTNDDDINEHEESHEHDVSSPNVLRTKTSKNYPTFMAPYKVPITNQDKLFVLFSLPGGSADPKLTVNSEGNKLTLEYKWPRAAYDPLDLFKGPIKDKEMSASDPVIAGISESLMNFRSNVEEVPTSREEFQLPFSVESKNQCIVIRGLKRDDGTTIITADLEGRQMEYQEKKILWISV